MTLPASHHPSWKTPTAWLAGGAALVLGGGILAAGLLGLRFDLWGRGSVGARAGAGRGGEWPGRPWCR